MSDLIKMVVEDYKFQVKDMSDDKLKHDRTHWMKNYGYPTFDDGEDHLEIDIHSITIQLEQLRRFGKIWYTDENEQPIKRTINEKPIQK